MLIGCLETNLEGNWGGRTIKHEGFIGLIKKLLTLNCLRCDRCVLRALFSQEFLKLPASQVIGWAEGAAGGQQARGGGYRQSLVANTILFISTLTANRDHLNFLTSCICGFRLLILFLPIISLKAYSLGLDCYIRSSSIH